MSARAIARFTAVCRLAIGAGFLAAPQRAMRPSIGRDAARPTARLLVRAVGARDVVIALGTLTADDEQALRRWAAGGLAADATDLALTLAARDHFRRGARLGDRRRRRRARRGGAGMADEAVGARATWMICVAHIKHQVVHVCLMAPPEA